MLSILSPEVVVAVLSSCRWGAWERIVSRLSVCGGLKMFRSSHSAGPTVSLTP